jgi:CDP-glucose 4,6-dehydratase
MPFGSFYKGKKVLVTGDTGFKGSWLASWLTLLGAETYGLGLEPDTKPSLFKILRLDKQIKHTVLDIRDGAKLYRYIRKVRPDVVFHLAAQAIVRLSYQIPIETLNTNFMGTANLLYAIQKAGYTTRKPCAIVVVTSDKCYENMEMSRPYCEDDRVGGHDIYSASKGAVELLVSSWRRSFFELSDDSAQSVFMASCRAGNVIGGGDWAMDRIVPDCIKSLISNKPIQIRNPQSIRPWQNVLEPLSGYLLVGALLGQNQKDKKFCCSAWNFGPGEESERRVQELCDAIIRYWGSGSAVHVPTNDNKHEARWLKLSTDKAKQLLKWRPVWDFEKAVEQTVSWYRLANECNYDSQEMSLKMRSKIELFIGDAAKKSIPWATS